jgi:hypothetical protein
MLEFHYTEPIICFDTSMLMSLTQDMMSDDYDMIFPYSFLLNL